MPPGDTKCVHARPIIILKTKVLPSLIFDLGYA